MQVETLAAHGLSSGCVVLDTRGSQIELGMCRYNRGSQIRARDVGNWAPTWVLPMKLLLDVPQIGLDQVFLRPYSTVFEMARRVFWNL